MLVYVLSHYLLCLFICYSFCLFFFFFFFFNDTATTEIYTLSLHDALPICFRAPLVRASVPATADRAVLRIRPEPARSEEHTSELQSHSDLVCRLLLEKKKKNKTNKSFLHNKDTIKHYHI